MNLMSARNWQVLESKTKGKEGVGRHGGWSSGGFAHGGLCVEVTRLKGVRHGKLSGKDTERPWGVCLGGRGSE